LGITLIDLVFSMMTFSASSQAFENFDVSDINNATILDMVHLAKLGVSPFRFGGAFGFLMLILPYVFYNFVYHPTKSLTYSMLPASWLEKFTSAWVMCVIAVPLLLFAFSLLVAFIGDLAGAQISYHALNLKLFLKNIYLPTICIQAIAFWGAFWFKRQKIGKTILTIAIILVGFGVIVYFIQRYQLFLGFFECLSNFFEKREGLRVFISTNIEAFIYGIICLLVALLWGLALKKYPRTQI
jgi:hypothetical protein